MKEKKILVLGGTGKTGRRVAERLINLGKDVRIGSRNETPSFDWEKAKTWVDVLRDMDSVYITFQPDLAVPSAIRAIKAFTFLAVEYGIQKMVLLSGRGEKEAQNCEQIVMNCGVNWTIVRCDWFNQNFSESFFLDPIKAGHVALPKGEALIPFVDTDDIADVVVETLLDDKHIGQVYELTGPRLLTFEEITSEISKVTGRDVQFHSISMDQYTNMLRGDQVPEDFIWLVKYLFTEVLDGRNSTLTNDIEKVLNRKAKDFTDYARDTVSTGVWDQLKKS